MKADRTNKYSESVVRGLDVLSVPPSAARMAAATGSLAERMPIRRKLADAGLEAPILPEATANAVAGLIR